MSGAARGFIGIMVALLVGCGPEARGLAPDGRPIVEVDSPLGFSDGFVEGRLTFASRVEDPPVGCDALTVLLRIDELFDSISAGAEGIRDEFFPEDGDPFSFFALNLDEGESRGAQYVEDLDSLFAAMHAEGERLELRGVQVGTVSEVPMDSEGRTKAGVGFGVYAGRWADHLTAGVHIVDGKGGMYCDGTFDMLGMATDYPRPHRRQ